jgi:ketosteroid isomerase-like protein
VSILSEAARSAAERACERLIREFAYHNDAGDYERSAACFTEDGSFARPTDPANPVRGRTAIRDFFRDRPPRISRHLLLNTVVDVVSEDRARARSYVLLFTGASGGALPATADPVQLVGDFQDRLRRVDGRWLFEERRGSVVLKTGATS